MSKEPKLVWCVFRDMYPSVVNDADYRTSHELHNIWSTRPLALAELALLCARHNIALVDNRTSLFKHHSGYAGYSLEYREVDVR